MLDTLQFSIYNYKDADFGGLQELLNYIPWDIAYNENNMDFSTVKWMDLFLAAINDCVPKIEVKSANSAPSRDQEVREHIPVPYDNLFQSILSYASRRQSYF